MEIITDKNMAFELVEKCREIRIEKFSCSGCVLSKVCLFNSCVNSVKDVLSIAEEVKTDG